ncbi:hypothetical protein F2Q68_00014780 [Brassica cretica]|uniref:Arabidopsis retrotransposon Orf1 C-terminal domain-containing protein n=1 Tax=Brassica cretica TaxID=69181 RepID=A0A8S9HQU0_BRACR|nr:hypothetical protein F2Q68_00014780 [Brassica cretica]
MGKKKDNAAKLSTAPNKGSMTTSAKGGSSSSSRAKGHKNKEMVREDPIEEEESHESEIEEESDDEPAPKKRTRAPKPPKKKKPPPSEITRLFKAMELLPTTYHDPLILQRLGLYDDVTIILGRMGLERLLTLQKLVYATATYQFLSSLEATHRSREDPEDAKRRDQESLCRRLVETDQGVSRPDVAAQEYIMGKKKDNAAKLSTSPNKGSMTTSAEGGSSSSSRAKGHKNKEMVREDPIEEEESHESESEDGSDDEHAPKKRTRASKPPKKEETTTFRDN